MLSHMVAIFLSVFFALCCVALSHLNKQTHTLAHLSAKNCTHRHTKQNNKQQTQSQTHRAHADTTSFSFVRALRVQSISLCIFAGMLSPFTHLCAHTRNAHADTHRPATGVLPANANSPVCGRIATDRVYSIDPIKCGKHTQHKRQYFIHTASGSVSVYACKPFTYTDRTPAAARQAPSRFVSVTFGGRRTTEASIRPGMRRELYRCG